MYGEVIDALHVARKYKLERNEDAWRLQSALMDFLESGWKQPDEGIWEVRGPRRDFTHSKVMAWVAVDRSIKEVRKGFGDGPLDRWLALRDQIHRDVCTRGFDADRSAFVQYYGSKSLDASLLMIPLVGFLPANGSARGFNRARDRAGIDVPRPGAQIPNRDRRRRPAAG